MRQIVLFFCTFISLNTLFAQMNEPVKWTFAAEKVSETEYDIVFTADIDRGWSVYSQFLGQGGPIPTSFDFQNSDEFQLVGEASEVGQKKEIYDRIFGMTLIKFTNKARFKQRIKIKDNINSVKGHVTYMTCDDSSCLPPTDVNFDIVLN